MHATGLLILRVALGAVFIAHGADKLTDLAATEASFDGLGIPVAGLMAPFVALVEVAGGALLVLGLLTPLAGVALAGNMLVAGLTAHGDGAFFAADGGFEFVLVLGAAALALAATGAGRLSLDARLGLADRFKRRSAVSA